MGYQDDLEEQSCVSHILILEVRFSFELKFFSDNLVTSDRPVLPKLILLNVNYTLMGKYVSERISTIIKSYLGIFQYALCSSLLPLYNIFSYSSDDQSQWPLPGV